MIMELPSSETPDGNLSTRLDLVDNDLSLLQSSGRDNSDASYLLLLDSQAQVHYSH